MEAVITDDEPYVTTLIRPWRGAKCDVHTDRIAYRMVDAEDSTFGVCQQCHKQKYSHLPMAEDQSSSL